MTNKVLMYTFSDTTGLKYTGLKYGEGGIRTHGTSLYTRFQVERIRPLCHLSKLGLIMIAENNPCWILTLLAQIAVLYLYNPSNE